MSQLIRLRLKYRQAGGVKQNKSRSRTGPRCCNGHCGRRVSKAAMVHLGRGRN